MDCSRRQDLEGQELVIRGLMVEGVEYDFPPNQRVGVVFAMGPANLLDVKEPALTVDGPNVGAATLKAAG